MENLLENRRWIVIPTSITGSINFSQTIEKSQDSLRFNIDKTKTFIKYDIVEVTASYTEQFINAETGETGSYIIEAGIYGRPDIYSPEYPEYKYRDILELLQTEEWASPIPLL